MRTHLTIIALAIRSLASAQPDTLYVPSQGEVLALAVVYDAPPPQEDYRARGHYAYDTTLLAVELDHKKGKPCGVYRAYYPDGSPLIFAVYGFNMLHGDWAEYDERGRIAVKGQYRDGLRDGVWAFRADGIVGHYKKGEKHGKWKYYVNGRVARTEKYHHNELVRSRYMGGDQ
jgi:hypothetical protein